MRRKLLFIALGARTPHCRALRAVEHPELESGGIGDKSGESTKRINLPDNLTFGNSSNSGVATHLCKTTKIRSKKENRGSHIGRGHGGFAAGVTSAYNYNVKTVVHTLSRRPR